MARKPLRSQLNQIRAWVRQGRTDAWIAHQLEVPASELREFVRRHDLSADEEPDTDADLRDEIEAEIEATMSEEEEAEDEEEDEDEEESGSEDSSEDSNGDGAPKRRRRRRGGRRRGPKRVGAGMQASFDHGDEEGIGLWMDPAITDDPVYSEHWAGHRKIEVTVEPDRIVIRRFDDAAPSAEDSDDEEQD
ncbi:hypothetical protein BH10ACT11_BH10ACT11_18070 [soil metagenome]